ncbi:MAG: hypothetical protein IPK82_20585 [Polyangiaceae bacterium]|nr:hypothetical protein [Polyangiaceae bacterium]
MSRVESDDAGLESDRSYRVDFRLGSDLFSEVGQQYISDIFGEITCTEDDGSDTLERVGTLIGHIIRVDRAWEDNMDLLDVCDEHSQTLYDYANVLFDFRQQALKKSLERQFDTPFSLNVLVADTVEILPSHRGQNVGLATVWHFLEQFSGGCGLAVCEPFPMQFKDTGADHSNWCSLMRAGDFVADQKLALQKLRTLWSRLGFERIRGTPKYALSLERSRPTLREVLEGGGEIRTKRVKKGKHQSLTEGDE